MLFRADHVCTARPAFPAFFRMVYVGSSRSLKMFGDYLFDDRGIKQANIRQHLALVSMLDERDKS